MDPNQNSEQLARGLAAAERKDWEEAARLLLPLAEEGDAVARCIVATMYSVGFGVPVDARKAAELYLDVAERGIEEGHLSALALPQPCGAPRDWSSWVRAGPRQGGRFRAACEGGGI